MSTPSAVPRTAPIAIAPKPPRFPPSRQGSINLDSYPGLRNGFDSPDSGSINGHPAHPCEACFRRRLDCVMSDDEEGCVRCVLSGAECSLLESPMPRKRKLNGFAEDSISKRRYVRRFKHLPAAGTWSARTNLQAGLRPPFLCFLVPWGAHVSYTGCRLGRVGVADTLLVDAVHLGGQITGDGGTISRASPVPRQATL